MQVNGAFHSIEKSRVIIAHIYVLYPPPPRQNSAQGRYGLPPPSTTLRDPHGDGILTRTLPIANFILPNNMGRIQALLIGSAIAAFE
ncbi:unnamed protein product [Arctogadus glacialis]